jgi:ABC-type Fe3+ transport system substrate-binding protein
MSIMDLGRRTFLAGLAPITITGAAVVAGSVNQDAAAALIRYLHGPVAAQANEASGMRRIA